MIRPLNVLLIDDDEIDLLTMQRIFARVGGGHAGRTELGRREQGSHRRGFLCLVGADRVLLTPAA